MAPLMGVSLALIPVLSVLGVAVGLTTIVLMRHSPLRSTWGIAICFIVMLAISQYYQIDRDLVTGLVILASSVLLRSMLTRRRRLSSAFYPVYRDNTENVSTEDDEVIHSVSKSHLGEATSGRP